jgi:hypothetical protein
MIKNFLFAMALLSLALAGGCAKGGSGGAGISVVVSVPNGINVLPVSQSVVLTATVTGTSNYAVTWTISGTGCTGSACGIFTATTPGTSSTNAATATYQAPATAPSPATVKITATSVAEPNTPGTLPLTVKQVTVVVAPSLPSSQSLTVGAGLVQQFTAVANPFNAPQSFTWSVTCTSGTNCGTISCGSNNPTCSTATSDPAVFTGGTPQSGVLVTATSIVQETTTNFGSAAVTVVATRPPAGTYAFQFSGYNNSGQAVATAGSVTLAANDVTAGDTITGGVEDVVIDGSYHQYTTVTGLTGSYTPSNNSNNAGTLTLSASGGPTYTYTAVLTSSGIIRMIESDSNGTGSGVMEESAASTVFNSGAQTFAFGFTGVDSAGNRVGYVGMLPLSGSGTISGGLADSNDNGTASSFSSVTGTYTADATTAGLWHMALTSPVTLDFDFFVAGGKAQTTTASGPLTLYAISTDSTYQALSGSMVYQVPLSTSTCAAPCYNNAAFNGTSVSNLTGVTPTVANSSNVALIYGTTDGTSSGTGGAGNFTNTFDQDNNGTILSVQAPTTNPNGYAYPYVASSSNTGRYIFQMLGNPAASTVVAPIPFVLYASGADRGFLLDQSSSAVMTGTMDPQPANVSYTATWMPGTFAAATIGNSDSGVAPVVDNLLFTYTQLSTGNVAGTENPGNVTQTGTYTMSSTGTGTVTLTAPAAAVYVIYAIDVTSLSGGNSAIADFMMIGSCSPQPCTSGTPSSVIFAQQ